MAGRALGRSASSIRSVSSSSRINPRELDGAAAVVRQHHSRAGSPDVMSEVLINFGESVARDPQIQRRLLRRPEVRQFIESSQLGGDTIEDLFESGASGTSSGLTESGWINLSLQGSTPVISTHEHHHKQPSKLPATNDEWETLRSHYKCQFCQGVLVAPRNIDCGNGHAFCGPCITRWIKAKPKCPTCNGTITQHHPIHLLDVPIRDAVERCPPCVGREEWYEAMAAWEEEKKAERLDQYTEYQDDEEDDDNDDFASSTDSDDDDDDDEDGPGGFGDNVFDSIYSSAFTMMAPLLTSGGSGGGIVEEEEAVPGQGAGEGGVFTEDGRWGTQNQRQQGDEGEQEGQQGQQAKGDTAETEAEGEKEGEGEGKRGVWGKLKQFWSNHGGKVMLIATAIVVIAAVRCNKEISSKVMRLLYTSPVIIAASASAKASSRR